MISRTPHRKPAGTRGFAVLYLAASCLLAGAAGTLGGCGDDGFRPNNGGHDATCSFEEMRELDRLYWASDPPLYINSPNYLYPTGDAMFVVASGFKTHNGLAYLIDAGSGDVLDIAIPGHEPLWGCVTYNNDFLVLNNDGTASLIRRIDDTLRVTAYSFQIADGLASAVLWKGNPYVWITTDETELYLYNTARQSILEGPFLIAEGAWTSGGGVDTDPAGHVWVCHYRYGPDDTVIGGISMFNVLSRSVETTIALGDQNLPMGLIIDADGNLWCIDYLANLIHVVSTADKEITDTIPLQAGANPQGINLDTSGNNLLISLPGTDQVQVVDRLTHELFPAIDTGPYPWGIAMDHLGRIWTANLKTDEPVPWETVGSLSILGCP